MSERESKQRRMHVAVVRIGSLDVFPPAINLVGSLVRQGHSVSLLANDVSKAGKLPFLGSESVKLVDLGTHEGNVLQREADNLRRRKIIRSYLGTHKSDIDVVWTVTDIAARETGRILFDFRHVMQLSELVEYVPALGMGSDIPLRSNLTIELARRADRVVVPEYNRACIQQVWWDLDRTPAVLPNKPQLPDEAFRRHGRDELHARFDGIGEKILLYQGVYAPDRSLRPFAEALSLLGDDYALALMGKPLYKTNENELRRDLESVSPHVHFMGFVPTPDHLAFTEHGYIGLLPYSPKTDTTRYSDLNALYCAPNKIWEYAHAGLPMLGSDVPGLRSQFERYDMGLVTDMTPEDIAAKVRLIEARHDEMAANARRFYDSIDFDAIVAGILEDVVR